MPLLFITDSDPISLVFATDMYMCLTPRYSPSFSALDLANPIGNRTRSAFVLMYTPMFDPLYTPYLIISMLSCGLAVRYESCLDRRIRHWNRRTLQRMNFCP